MQVSWNLPRQAISTVTDQLERLPGADRVKQSSYINQAVIGGAIATVVAMQILFTIPAAIEFEEFRRLIDDQFNFYFLHNPFPPLPFLGGIIGGYVVGYLTRGRWYIAIQNTVIGVIGGVFLYYLTNVFGQLRVLLLADISIIDAILIATLQPFIFVFLPFALLYFFEGVFAGLIGNAVGHILKSKYAFDKSSGEELPWSPTRLAIRQWTVSLIILIFLFVFAWWFIFSTEARF